MIQNDLKNVKFGLIGHPLGHSLSGIIHSAAMKSVGVKGEYLLFDTDPEYLIDQVKYFKSQNFLGFNVTIPFKVPITLFLDDVDNLANLISSVNTVKITSDRRLIGYNTDVYGFKNAIPSDFDLKQKKIALIGLGGASRAILAAFSQIDVECVDVYVRNVINANEFLSNLRINFPNLQVNLFQMQNLKTLEHYKMLVNATPVGMRGHSMDLSPVGEALLETFDKTGIVYDIIYNPVKTKLIKDSINLGIRTINGLDMLVFQAAKAFEIWTGLSPDVKLMKIAALEQML
ncbi:MAG: shikimate dehydrogenase [Candidatus Gastranaerophilales bacterium]|nr:shikimate dehydrogenase [Candidatus Gastranaerophilales bacterium]